ncbi:MAG: GIY-YIG nuclease family protein [Deltaproteobacteria bacterium]|nr:GIY-YIG nuclease family protein [Deltaproteobacteria bacterium]
MNPGHIYILQNPSFPNLLKIGKTNRSPKARAQELSSSSGVPTEFNVIFDVFVPDCDAGEIEVHAILKQYRASSNREFFAVSMEIAKEVSIEIAIKQINNEILLLENTIDEKVLRYRNNLLKEVRDKKKYLEKILSSSTSMTTKQEISPLSDKSSEYEELMIKAIKWGKERVIKRLLEKNVRIPLTDNSGRSVREIAKKFGHEDVYTKYLAVMNRRTK